MAAREVHIKGPLGIYVPNPNARLKVALATSGIALKSAIVGADGPDEDGRVLIDYEGNMYGAENLRPWRSRLTVAEGRHRARYPTIARRSVSAEALKRVGTLTEWEMRITDDVALAAWLGVKPDGWRYSDERGGIRRGDLPQRIEQIRKRTTDAYKLAEGARKAEEEAATELLLAELRWLMQTEPELTAIKLQIEWEYDHGHYFEGLTLLEVVGDDVRDPIDDPQAWSASSARAAFGMTDEQEDGVLTRAQLLGFEAMP